MWTDDEVQTYDRLKKKTEDLKEEMPVFVKRIIERNL